MLVDTGLPEGVAPIIAITVVAVLFRFTETLPLHVTGLLVCALLVVLGGVPADKVFTNIFDPSVVLLFGGLVLAVMLQKYKLDSKLVCLVLNRPSYHPKRFLLLIMAVSAFLSMRISNTAAAALMIPLALHVVSSCCRGYKEKNITKAAVIGTAYATTLGGMATVVGSPPNFIAASAIQKAGFQFGFVERFIHAFPVVVLLVLAAWFLLIKLFPIDIDRITMPSDMHCEFEQRKKQRRVIIIFCITVVGRLTTGYTGISSTIIALIPLFL